MNVREAIEGRRSIRQYSDEKPDMKEIIELVNISKLAPSAGNLQSRKAIIIDDEQMIQELSEASSQPWMSTAPIIVLICADLDRVKPYGKRGEELYCIQDTAAMAQSILLLSIEKGLSTCWVGAFNESMISKIVGLPHHLRPVIMITIGL